MTWLNRLVLIAGPFLAPSAASACNRPMPTGLPLHPATALAPVTAPQPAHQHEPGSPLPERRPCSGPNCSQKPLPLPAAPATAPVVTIDRWTGLSGQLPPTSDGPAAVLPDVALGSPEHLPFRIEHPPRLS